MKFTGPRLECDRRTLLIVFALIVVGASLVASSSSYFSARETGDPYLLLRKHLERIVIAMLFLVLTMRIDYRVYRRIAPAVLGVAVVTLIGLFVMGRAVRGAQSWLTLGPIGVTFQPNRAL